MPCLPSEIAENGSASTRSQVGLPLLNCAAMAPSVGPVPSSLTVMPVSFKNGWPKACVIGLDRVAAPIDQNQLLLGGAGAAGAEREGRAGEQRRRQLREAPAADLAAFDFAGEDFETIFLEGVVHRRAPAFGD